MEPFYFFLFLCIRVLICEHVVYESMMYVWCMHALCGGAHIGAQIKVTECQMSYHCPPSFETQSLTELHSNQQAPGIMFPIVHQLQIDVELRLAFYRFQLLELFPTKPFLQLSHTQSKEKITK